MYDIVVRGVKNIDLDENEHHVDIVNDKRKVCFRTLILQRSAKLQNGVID